MLGPLLFVRLDLEQALVGLDGFLDRLPIGQHAAEPAVVDVVLPAPFGLLLDARGRLSLGAHEEHVATTRNGFAHVVQAGLETRQRLVEIENVGPVARAKNERAHQGIPTVGLVAEMGTGLEQRTNAQVGLLESLGRGSFRRGRGGGRITLHRRRRRRLAHALLLRGWSSAPVPLNPNRISPAPQGRTETCVVPTPFGLAAALGSKIQLPRPSWPHGGRWLRSCTQR